MFGPSLLLSGTMASADFLRFVVTTHFFPCVRKTSPGTHTFFPSLPAAFTVSDSVQLLGFILRWKLALVHGLICDFYSSGQRFAAAFLQILPHDRHPWLRLYPSRCRADSGLSPFRTYAHRAHAEQQPLQRFCCSGCCLCNYIKLFCFVDGLAVFYGFQHPNIADLHRVHF